MSGVAVFLPSRLTIDEPLPRRVEVRLKTVLSDLGIQAQSIYAARSRGRGCTGEWLRRQGRHLVVDLDGAAQHFEQDGCIHIADKLRGQAQAIRASRQRTSEVTGQ